MIDLRTETLISLDQARTHRLLVNRGRNGKPPLFSTILRWTKAGVNGAVLEFVKNGRTKMTTDTAIVAFIEAQNRPPQPINTEVVTQRQAEKARRRVLDRLASKGIGLAGAR